MQEIARAVKEGRQSEAWKVSEMLSLGICKNTCQERAGRHLPNLPERERKVLTFGEWNYIMSWSDEV